VTVYALVSGLRLRQRYVLSAPLGTGGMSEVWQAEDEVLRRAVAVKALAPDLAADPVLREGVRREARAVASLNHPHITRVYDHGETALPDGSVVTYLVMELVEGRTLAARLTDGPLPWPEAARIAGQVASALAAAHRAGLVHRDVKPANVMLTEAGAKMLDFGIAALAGPGARATAGADPVAPGIGTPAYAAPEWLTGAAPHPASDVYGIGALLHEALTGQPAVRARNWAQAAEIHRRGAAIPPPDVSGLPPQVARLCLACLAPDPRDRPSAAAVARILDRPRPGASPRRRLRPTLVRRGARQPDGVPQPDDGGPGADQAPEAAIRPAGQAKHGAGSTVRRPRAGRAWPTVRPAGVALLGAVAAGVLVLALAAAALLDRRTPGAEAGTVPAVAATSTVAVAPTPQTPQTPPGPAAPAPGTTTPPTTGPTGPPAERPAGPTDPPPEQPSPTAVVDEFDRRLTSAASAGLVRADVAVDLRNGLTDLRDRISRGQTGDLRRRVENLRKKLSERVAERGIDAGTAAQLSTLLDPLLTA
jgi:serine/threonine-protein kinase